MTELALKLIYEGTNLRYVSVRCETKIDILMQQWLDYRLNQAY